MTPETVYQRFRKKRITTVTRLEYDNSKLITTVRVDRKEQGSSGRGWAPLEVGSREEFF